MYKNFTAKYCRKPIFYSFKFLLMMKAMVLLTFVFVQVAMASRGQEVSIRVTREPITKVLYELSQQSGYDFIYDAKLMEKMTLITLNVNNESLESVLQRCFASQPFEFVFNEDKTIVIRKRRTPPFIAPILQQPVTGSVVDSTGRPLTGVSILVKGSQRGTATNAEGQFQIDAKPGEVLVFSNIGYENQEVTVGNQQRLAITLAPTYSDLEEVVVTALGITREKKSLSYSAQNIGGDQLSQAKESNMINSLQGKVAGVNITKNPEGPGGESRVVLRGNRSITGNNQPLYVIDGVPLDGGISMINSDDIASMTVLKGASAAALYGSAGQNGAIIITTKRPEAGPLAVDFSTGFTWDRPTALPEFQYEYGQGSAGVFSPNSEHSWGPKADGQEVTLWNGSTVPLVGQPDRFDEFFRTGKTFSNSLMLTGGTETIKTYFSYANMLAGGIMQNNDLTRHNFDFKISNQLSSKLSFDSKISYIYDDVFNRPSLGETGFSLTSIYRAPTSIPISEMEKFEYVNDEGDVMQSYWKPNSSVLGNPFFYMNRNIYHQRKDRVLGLLSATYKLASWVDILVRGSIDKTITKWDRRVYADSYYSLVGANYFLRNTNRYATNMDALASFRHDFTPDLKFTGNIGGSIQESRYEEVYTDANGLNKANFFEMSNAKAPIVTTDHGRSPQIQALYATATLAYRDYLFLDVTARNDWSSALPEGNQSYFYPSVGLIGILSDMFTMPSWISYGKARVSYANAGSGGNQYLNQNYYTVGAGGLILTPTIQSFNTYKPEITSSTEVGLEWRFFNSRFGFDVTYYDSRTKNQLLLIGAPSASLYDQRYINAGLIQNYGVEALITATPVRSTNFSWDVSVNYAKNNNKIIRLTDDISSVIIRDDRLATIRVTEGDRYGDMYSKAWRRDEQGRRLVDNNGSPLLTAGKDLLVGNFNPNYMLGFSNNFRYRDFSLSFLLDYRNGGVVLSGTQALIDADGHSRNSLEGRENGLILDAYTVDGERNDKTISAQTYWSAIGDRYPTGELYTYSATNLRLREVVLGYSLPSELLSGSKFIRAARLSLVGRNLFFLQRDAPFDPELTLGTGNGGGLEYGSLPSTRSFGFNLRLSF